MKNFSPLSILVLGLVAMAPVRAERHIFLENRGPDALCVEGTRVQGRLSQSAWTQPEWGSPPPGSAFRRGSCRYVVGPGASIEFLRTNWNKGVTKGHTFTFATTVRTRDGERLELTHELLGKTIGSSLRRKVGKGAWAAGGVRRDAWPTSGGLRSVKHGDEGDDLRYTFGAPRNPPAPLEGSRPGELKVMVWDLGVTRDGLSQEFRRQVEHLSGHDVLVLSGVPWEQEREYLSRSISGEYPYQVRGNAEGGDEGKPWSVTVFSRWPILAQESIRYRASRGGDRVNVQGAIYAAVAGPWGTTHVVATRTQGKVSLSSKLNEAVWDSALLFPANGLLGRGERRSVEQIRAEQLDQLGVFVRRLRLPRSEPFLLAGPWSAPSEDGGALDSLVQDLGAEAVVAGQLYVVHPGRWIRWSLGQREGRAPKGPRPLHARLFLDPQGLAPWSDAAPLAREVAGEEGLSQAPFAPFGLFSR
jgi:hypothetical protein